MAHLIRAASAMHADLQGFEFRTVIAKGFLPFGLRLCKFLVFTLIGFSLIYSFWLARSRFSMRAGQMGTIHTDVAAVLWDFKPMCHLVASSGGGERAGSERAMVAF
jgi:hypothetical protein